MFEPLAFLKNGVKGDNMKHNFKILGVALLFMLFAVGSFIAYYVLFFIIFVVAIFAVSKLIIVAKDEYEKEEKRYQKEKQFMNGLKKE